MPQVANQLTNRLAGNRANGDPVSEPILINANLGRISQWIVDAQLFDEPTIAGAAAVGRDNTIERNLFPATAGESNGD